MDGQLNYIIFNTDMGWAGIAGTADGLTRIILPRPSAQEIRERLKDIPGRGIQSPDLFQDLMNRFRLYYSGRVIDFPDRLDLTKGTPFQRKVWETAKLIPYGQTQSYGWIARQMGNPKAVRAVGQALGKNPLPIIVPCHRVLAGGGKLGGFSSGLDLKRRLLGLENPPGLHLD